MYCALTAAGGLSPATGRHISLSLYLSIYLSICVYVCVLMPSNDINTNEDSG